jgi:hypothetical protein
MPDVADILGLPNTMCGREVTSAISALLKRLAAIRPTDSNRIRLTARAASQLLSSSVYY